MQHSIEEKENILEFKINKELILEMGFMYNKYVKYVKKGENKNERKKNNNRKSSTTTGTTCTNS